MKLNVVKFWRRGIYVFFSSIRCGKILLPTSNSSHIMENINVYMYMCDRKFSPGFSIFIWFSWEKHMREYAVLYTNSSLELLLWLVMLRIVNKMNNLIINEWSINIHSFYAHLMILFINNVNRISIHFSLMGTRMGYGKGIIIQRAFPFALFRSQPFSPQSNYVRRGRIFLTFFPPKLLPHSK